MKQSTVTWIKTWWRAWAVLFSLPGSAMGRETIYLCYDFRRFSKAGDDRNVNESRKYLSTDRGGGRIRTEKGGRSIATGLGRKPVGGCYSAEMRRPAIRSTAHDPILSYPTYQPPIQDVSLQISVTNCVPLRGYTIKLCWLVKLDVLLQSGAVLTRSSITWYCTHHWNGYGRIQIRASSNL